MNWDEVGAIGQVLGSIAVLMTLGYLAVQVRHARAEMRRSVAHDRVNRLIQLNMPLVTDERLVALHAKADTLLGGDAPPPHLNAMMKKFGFTLEQAISLHVELFLRWQSMALTIEYIDELSSAERAHFDRSSRGEFAEPCFRFWYEHAKPTLQQEAVRYVDNLSAPPRSTAG